MLDLHVYYDAIFEEWDGIYENVVVCQINDIEVVIMFMDGRTETVSFLYFHEYGKVNGPLATC